MTLMILCVAAFGLAAYVVSGLVAIILWPLRRRIERLAPAARARLVLLAALLPLMAAIAVLIAALAPTFGWIADHCLSATDPHGHPHICAAHHVPAWPALTLSALALVVVARFAIAAARRCYALGLGSLTRAAFDRISTPGAQPDVRVLPVDEPQAFVLGLVRPRLYVTRGLVASEPAHLSAVIAHERAHVARLDPLRRFVAGVGLAFHLPGIGRWLDRWLGRSQEMAADEAAASIVGRAGVARALVALARSRAHLPRSAFAFAGSDVERRVVELMDGRERRDWPRLSTLLGGAVLAAVVVAAGADAVHHGLELLLGAFGS